jgi:hypothetical protein
MWEEWWRYIGLGRGILGADKNTIDDLELSKFLF